MGSRRSRTSSRRNPQGSFHPEDCARFSPDGKWVAYSSNESGKWYLLAIRTPNRDRVNGRIEGQPVGFAGIESECINVRILTDFAVASGDKLDLRFESHIAVYRDTLERCIFE